MERFNIVKESKFEKMSVAEMQAVTGGRLCIACMKRERSFKVGVEGSNWYFGRNNPPIYDDQYNDMY